MSFCGLPQVIYLEVSKKEKKKDYHQLLYIGLKYFTVILLILIGSINCELCPFDIYENREKCSMNSYQLFISNTI